MHYRPPMPLSSRYPMSAVRDIHRGAVVHLTVEEVTLPNGHVMPLEIVRHPGASAIAALGEDGTVTLLRQYRHAVGSYLWEVPAGKLDPGESPATCAARELAEEAGLVAERLEQVGSVVTCPGFCDEVIHLFVATGLRSVATALEADEVIDTITTVRLSRAMQMIGSGEIRDAKTIAALVHAELSLGHGRRPS